MDYDENNVIARINNKHNTRAPPLFLFVEKYKRIPYISSARRK